MAVCIVANLPILLCNHNQSILPAFLGRNAHLDSIPGCYEYYEFFSSLTSLSSTSVQSILKLAVAQGEVNNFSSFCCCFKYLVFWGLMGIL